jgi:predicted GIY-YIG superfamily endonuclease
VFGGDHGEFPLLGSQGELIAEAIGETPTPAILDTTRMKTTERMRFFTDFADTILRVNRGPLRLVIDEAHLFARYIGVTADLKRRLIEHNSGKSIHTSKFAPWRIVTYVAFSDRAKAASFERYVKSGSGHAFASKRLW